MQGDSAKLQGKPRLGPAETSASQGVGYLRPLPNKREKLFHCSEECRADEVFGIHSRIASVGRLILQL
jgi:hypothetical protein